jgi:hypothetical protein
MTTPKCEHSFSCYLMGTETPIWRAELIAANAVHAGLNFYSGLGRFPKSKPWLLEDHFPEEMEILVDSGSFSQSKRPIADHDSYNLKYRNWVEQNLDRLTLILEYDPERLELSRIKEWRADFWDGIPAEKFVPVWHESHGVGELEELCSRYRHVGLTRPPITLVGKLRSLVSSEGVQLHGVGINSVVDIAKLPIASVSTQSWINPTRTRTLFVWAQNRMQTYSGKDVDKAIDRHQRDILAAGFDPASMVGDERRELARYSIWCWQQFEQDLRVKRDRTGGGVITAIRPGADTTQVGSSTPGSENGADTRASYLPAVRESTSIFPGMSLVDQTVKVEGEEDRSVSLSVMQESGLRVCDSCYLSSRCPAFNPGTQCAFRMPVSIDTPEALKASVRSVIQLQFARVVFARAGEEADGAMADPIVSAEIDRYMGVLKMAKELEESSEFLEIKVKGNQGGGLLERILSNTIGARTPVPAAESPRLDAQAAERYIGDVIDVGEEDE